MTYVLVVLAGGRGSRLGGANKADLIIDGTRLLDAIIARARALDIPPDGFVVVGPASVVVPEGCERTLEDPPFGGPAAGLAAGAAVAARRGWGSLAVVPCDAPSAVACLPSLFAGRRGDGALAVAADRDQNAVAVFDTAALVAACATGTRDLSLRRLLGRLDLARVEVDPSLVADIDTPADAARAGATQP